MLAVRKGGDSARDECVVGTQTVLRIQPLECPLEPIEHVVLHHQIQVPGRIEYVPNRQHDKLDEGRHQPFVAIPTLCTQFL